MHCELKSIFALLVLLIDIPLSLSIDYNKNKNIGCYSSTFYVSKLKTRKLAVI